MNNDAIVICSPVRTAIGSFLGSLKNIPSPKLGAQCLSDIIQKNEKLSADLIDEVYMGCVLSSGLGQAPARQAAIFAGLNKKTPCTTVSKVCGSGLKSAMLAHSQIKAGLADCILTGGMENMSQSPFLIQRAREGLRLGHGEFIDSMVKDGLWDVYNDYHMGNAADLCAKEFNISREDQDNYAIQSYKRAQDSLSKELFKDEIVPVDVKIKKDKIKFSTDEEALKVKFEKIPQLRPVFSKEGSVTAANASTLNDGASAMIVCKESFALKNELNIFAKIIHHTQAAREPEQFTVAPTDSINNLLAETELKTTDIDLWEINEAFSVVALANLKKLNLKADNVNIRGGSVALGHPIGASGARILTTLAHTLKAEQKRYGIASLCIGGGEAVSMLIENYSKPS